MFRQTFLLAAVLLCSYMIAGQVVPNSEIGRITIQVPLLSNGKPVIAKDQVQDQNGVEIARVEEIKPLNKDEVIVPLAKLRNVRAIRDGSYNHAIPNPGIPNSGIPNLGIPNRGLPNPGIPNNGIPNPGIPNSGIPNEGIPNRGLPNPGIPNPGLPNPGIPNDGIPNPGIPNRGLPNPGIPNPGLPNPGIPNPGIPNEGIPNRGLPNPGIPNPGLPNRGIPNDGIPNPGIPNHGLPNPGIPNPGLPNPGIPLHTAASEQVPMVAVLPPQPDGNKMMPMPMPTNRVHSKNCHHLLFATMTTTSPAMLSPSSKPGKEEEECDELCTKHEYIPICAFNGICVHEFANECLMDTFNCKHRDLAFRMVDEDVCRMDLCARRCKTDELQI